MAVLNYSMILVKISNFYNGSLISPQLKLNKQTVVKVNLKFAGR